MIKWEWCTDGEWKGYLRNAEIAEVSDRHSGFKRGKDIYVWDLNILGHYAVFTKLSLTGPEIDGGDW